MFDVLHRLSLIDSQFSPVEIVARTPSFEVYHSQTMEIGGKRGLDLFVYLLGNKKRFVLVLVVVVNDVVLVVVAMLRT